LFARKASQLYPWGSDYARIVFVATNALAYYKEFIGMMVVVGKLKLFSPGARAIILLWP
jgi:hypothetical protein